MDSAFLLSDDSDRYPQELHDMLGDEQRAAVGHLAIRPPNVRAGKLPFTQWRNVDLANGDTRMLSRHSFAVAILAVGLPLLENPALSDTLHIDRNLILWSGEPSNTLPPGAYQITRSADGDYIVSGAVNLSDTEAWATRLDSTGNTRWQFIDGPVGGWKAGGANLNRFYGAIVLPDNSTLLCGTTHVAKKSVALLVYISANGKLTSEIHLVPKGYEEADIRSCFKWGSGFGLLGTASYPSPGTDGPKSSGWLCKLSFPGTIVWNKFDLNFAGTGVIETLDHNLLIMTSNYKGTKVSMVDTEGVISLQHSVPDDAYFMQPLFRTSNVHVGYMIDTFITEFTELDQKLRSSSNVIRVENVGIKKGYALADGSLIVFGSTFKHMATPNIARVYRDSRFTNLPVAPPREGGWISDAVPSGSPNQYVFVRVAGEHYSVMSWVTVH